MILSLNMIKLHLILKSSIKDEFMNRVLFFVCLILMICLCGCSFSTSENDSSTNNANITSNIDNISADDLKSLISRGYSLAHIVSGGGTKYVDYDTCKEYNGEQYCLIDFEHTSNTREIIGKIREVYTDDFANERIYDDSKRMKYADIDGELYTNSLDGFGSTGVKIFKIEAFRINDMEYKVVFTYYDTYDLDTESYDTSSTDTYEYTLINEDGKWRFTSGLNFVFNILTEDCEYIVNN